MHLVFWQPVPSFHQQGFLNALAGVDWVDSVTLRYERELESSRLNSGWQNPRLVNVRQEIIAEAVVPENTSVHCHFFTGFNTHRKIWAAHGRLPANRRGRCFAFAEAPELYGVKGWLRRMKYRYAAKNLVGRLDGVLALGSLGKNFYQSILPKGFPVHEFAYYDQQHADLAHGQDGMLPDGDEFRFLFVGQLIRRKGLDRLLRTLAQLPENVPEWKMDIVGCGPEKAALMKQAQSSGIASHLEWHGRVENTSLAKFYQNADCLVLPSRWDGWGMTVNEGLRYGCCPLATQQCGVASVLPESCVFPSAEEAWPRFLADIIGAGKLSLSAREGFQKLACGLTGEAGADRLHSILNCSRGEGIPA